MATSAPVEKKVAASSVAAFLGSTGLLAVLTAVQDNAGLVGGLPDGLELVARDAELAARAEGRDVAVAVDDLGAGVGHQRADGGEAAGDGVVREGVEAGGARLGEAVAAREVGHAEHADQLLHQGPRDGGTGHDARAEGCAAEVGREALEEGVEHGGDAVQRGAPLGGDG